MCLPSKRHIPALTPLIVSLVGGHDLNNPIGRRIAQGTKHSNPEMRGLSFRNVLETKLNLMTRRTSTRRRARLMCMSRHSHPSTFLGDTLWGMHHPDVHRTPTRPKRRIRLVSKFKELFLVLKVVCRTNLSVNVEEKATSSRAWMPAPVLCLNTAGICSPGRQLHPTRSASLLMDLSLSRVENDMTQEPTLKEAECFRKPSLWEEMKAGDSHQKRLPFLSD